jgi:hypothetical protein
MSELTFRDFAAAIMRGDPTAASSVLEPLLGLPAQSSTAATTHFRARMAEPSFMPKAMGLRSALVSGNDDEIKALLSDCFGLDAEAQAMALTTLRQRYPG